MVPSRIVSRKFGNSSAGNHFTTLGIYSVLFCASCIIAFASFRACSRIRFASASASFRGSSAFWMICFSKLSRTILTVNCWTIMKQRNIPKRKHTDHAITSIRVSTSLLFFCTPVSTALTAFCKFSFVVFCRFWIPLLIADTESLAPA